MELKLVHKTSDEATLTPRRSHPKYKEYVKYRASIVSGSKQSIFTFSEWLRDTSIYNNRYF